jgi:signal transduction histidine kinase
MASFRRGISRASRSRLVDPTLALMLGSYGVAAALIGGEWPQPHWFCAVLVAASAAFLGVRRRLPTASYVGALGALALISLTVGDYEAGSSLLIVLLASYSVGAYGGHPRVAAGVATGYVVASTVHRSGADAVTAALFIGLMLVLPFGLGLTVRRLRVRAQELTEWAARLQLEQETLAAAAAAEAAKTERLRIARELHDIVSHGLGLMVLQAGVAQNLLTRDLGRARQALDLVRQTGQESMAEMGRLVSLIRADGAGPDPQPTFADIDRLVGAQRAAGARVDLDTQGCPRRLSPAVELSAYRVVQESLTNAMKHAADSPVRVVLSYQEQALCVEVSNDAGGGQVGVRSQSARAGLVGLRERVDVFGGQLFAGPGAHGGWTVRALFPTQR